MTQLTHFLEHNVIRIVSVKLTSGISAQVASAQLQLHITGPATLCVGQ